MAGRFRTFTRAQAAEKYLADYRFRQPDADTREGSLPAILADLTADTVAPIYAAAVTIADLAASRTRTGKDLDVDAVKLGTARLPATGATGFVTITASAGGGPIQVNDEIVIGGKRYRAILSGVYADGDEVAVTGVDVGPSTDQPAGAVGTWSAPRAGIGPRATVFAAADGSGLSNGRFAETDDELDARLARLRESPPVSGNDAEIRERVTRAPGIAVEAVFSYPAIKGPGTTGVAFTMRGAGTARIPSAAQRALALGSLSALPGDDGILDLTIVPEVVDVILRITWRRGYGWTDARPLPSQSPGGVISAATSPLACEFTSLSGIGIDVPIPGQTIGVFDASTRTFKRKQILTVTPVGGSVYTLTFDPSAGASDTKFLPVVGSVVSPWNDALPDVATAVAAAFDRLGPGEMIAPYDDLGLRGMRTPATEDDFPASLSAEFLGALYALPQVSGVVPMSPSLPRAPSLGSAGVSVRLLTLGNLAVLP